MVQYNVEYNLCLMTASEHWPLIIQTEWKPLMQLIENVNHETVHFPRRICLSREYKRYCYCKMTGGGGGGGVLKKKKQKTKKKKKLPQIF